ncbi:dihydroxyacetone kinase phosphoryl donor subunit DhaM [Puerhibacterium puerhi]|uniref:dihydroxyacetone kinase phosphoryl donor subunit DhaM n=1 Tax=Puerhibacterium puerhi TaxID=2692623 RepID=UPI00135AD44A|nr:dihydroxyacetone kinase phosphoryl donor subunit DhaM [Puerhibacterium puerhi]
MSVALVLVSHSARLAEGAAELAGQMAPDVAVLPGAGMPDGTLGTSYDVVRAAVDAALARADAAAVLADLGSAVLTVESVLELDDDLAGRVRLATAPFVEGAVAAAVAAQQGKALADVVAAAEAAGATFVATPGGGAVQPGGGATKPEAAGGPAQARAAAAVGAGVESAPAPGAAGRTAAEDRQVARVVVRDPLGLHARPAAVLARTVAELGVPVTVDGADAASLLQLMTLGVRGGTEVEVAASGPGAAEAVRAVVALLEQNPET